LLGSAPLTDGFQSCDSSAAHTAPLAFASSTTRLPSRSDFASVVSPSLKSCRPKICSPRGPAFESRCPAARAGRSVDGPA
jgi:hypothetical protein